MLPGITAPAHANIYEEDIPELTDTECAQCHVPVYEALKDEGGAHQMGCRDCHDTFHNFSRSLSWEERVPACTSCHGTPHGEHEPMQDCLECHANAHAPVASIETADIQPYCNQCHASQAEEISNPSAHADMGCSGCHYGDHGYVPDCTECHSEPHNPFESNTACTSCHPVHDVSRLDYGPHVENSGCSHCHSSPAKALDQGHLAHSALNCTFCHAKEHGNIPTCQECHDTPHTQEMLEEFDGCADCHGGAHALLPGY
jgi:predicted CXXCH cytochrome family protein